MSGWLLGADGASDKLSTALSAYRIRDLVAEIPQRADQAQADRGCSNRSRSEEGSLPPLVANLLAQMKPPIPLPEPVDETTPGYYKLEVVVRHGEPPVSLLPPASAGVQSRTAAIR